MQAHAVEARCSPPHGSPQAAERTADALVHGVEVAELSACERAARCELEKLSHHTPHTAENGLLGTRMHLREHVVDENMSSTAQGSSHTPRTTQP